MRPPQSVDCTDLSAQRPTARNLHELLLMTQRTPTSLVLMLAVSGCVSAGKYDQTVADAATRLRAAQVRAAADLATRDRQLADSNDARREVGAKNAEQSEELHQAIDRYAGCSTSLDEVTAQDQQLARGELARLGKNVDDLLSSKGVLAEGSRWHRPKRGSKSCTRPKSLLRRALHSSEIWRSNCGEWWTRASWKSSCAAGAWCWCLPTDVLFDSGKAKLGSRGKEAVSQVASVLATLKDRRFQVSGHTDNDPIRYSGFESNWDLSAARALQVVKVMADSGMSPSSLSAAGYGEFDPVAANDTVDHKAKNRRIEIGLQPNIDELVAIPKTN